MATNYIQPGHKLTLTAPTGGVTSGLGYQIGSLFVVAEADAAASASFVGSTCGVYELAKTTSQAWTEGAKIYWDDSTDKCTTTASSNLLIGNAVEAEGANDTTGKVRLNGAPA